MFSGVLIFSASFVQDFSLEDNVEGDLSDDEFQFSTYEILNSYFSIWGLIDGLDGSNTLKAGFKEQKCFVQFDSQELATII